MCGFSALYAADTDSVLNAIDNEMFPVEKIIKCEYCGAQNLSFSKYCTNCGASLISQEIAGYLSVKAGGFIPVNTTLREAYGTSIAYGIGLNMEYSWFGVRLEIENNSLERLVPVTTVANSAPVEGDWRNTNSRLSVTPIMLSLLVNQSFREWKGYFGIGFGAAMIREEFKGDYYFRESATSPLAWGYADIIDRENFLAYQALLGVIKSDKIGFELKYSYIPTLNKLSFSDLGGLSLTISLLF
jgi:hypothetical protein